MNRKLGKNYIEFSVTGDYAMFSDVITRAGGEHTSYEVPTYEALKGITQSIYFKPTIIWTIDKVRVMNRIKTVRKGVRPISYGGGNDLAYYSYLSDVHYQVMAHFDWNYNRPELEQDRNLNKHSCIARRMVERGGRRDCFLGTRECQCIVEPCAFGEGEGYYDNSGEIGFEMSYYGMIYADEAEYPEDKGKMTVTFHENVMKDGVIEFIPPKDCTVKRHIKDMPIKPFGREHNNFTGLEEFEEGEFDELG